MLSHSGSNFFLLLNSIVDNNDEQRYPRCVATIEHITKGFLKIVFRSLLVVAVLISYGGGSSLLQGVAWISMLPKQISLSGSFEKGVERTFSGDETCPICELAESIRHGENSPPLHDPDKGSAKTEIKEKNAFGFLSIKLSLPKGSVLKIPQEQKIYILSTPIEVELPPPSLA